MTDSPEDLRQWRLPRGRHGLSREVIARSQRERLLAAVVRVTADKGYEAMSVADILNLAGVGRQSFYELFADKGACLLAAHALLVDDLEGVATAAFDVSGPWPGQVKAALAAVLGWLAAHPEEAQVTLVELAAVGPVARERFLVSFARFSAMLDPGLKEPGAASDLPNLTSFAAATVLVRVYEETVRGQTAGLPALLPELTFELLMPFLGEDAARTAADGA